MINYKLVFIMSLLAFVSTNVVGQGLELNTGIGLRYLGGADRYHDLRIDGIDNPDYSARFSQRLFDSSDVGSFNIQTLKPEAGNERFQEFSESNPDLFENLYEILEQEKARRFTNPLIESLIGSDDVYCGTQHVCGGTRTPPIPPRQPLNGSALDYCLGAGELLPLCQASVLAQVSDAQPHTVFKTASDPETVPTISTREANGYPSVVGIATWEGPICSGILLSKRIVVTAAHCLCDLHPKHAWIGNSMVADEEYRSGLNVSREFSGEVDFFDDGYCRVGAGTDLAVAYLRNGSGISNSFYHDLVSDQPPMTVAFAAKIVGFGASEGSLLGGVKRHADVVASPCTESHVRAGEDCFPSREWISTNTDGVDTCKGDSGGPIYAHTKGGTLKLIGMTSRKRGGGIAQYCGDGGIYTDLTRPEIHNWLNQLIKGDHS